ncbi:MAG TPA: hypothetical protein DHV69_08795 [Sphaerochaeta sp.]|nr:MAG: hypothetical protein A2Y31_04475 [Spirochaetes bacterium GWC2_52_13]OHD63054.1 MAG: hypothetical protein A2101_01275 [Spirochaetes bacterium GWF2_52_7]HCG63296.1 hypothetical protein [Sphaerochaeta sp.]HCJ95262.1 hypothetical protein [Sphaerochaeta sp.]HCS36620.1 hypothetical protein [Sphaerochaeta sp.]
MRKSVQTFRTVALVLLAILFVVSPLVASRVVASETLTIHAFVPERTAVSFSATGELIVSSNAPGTLVSILPTADATLLSVTAR